MGLVEPRGIPSGPSTAPPVPPGPSIAFFLRFDNIPRRILYLSLAVPHLVHTLLKPALDLGPCSLRSLWVHHRPGLRRASLTSALAQQILAHRQRHVRRGQGLAADSQAPA